MILFLSVIVISIPVLAFILKLILRDKFRSQEIYLYNPSWKRFSYIGVFLCLSTVNYFQIYVGEHYIRDFKTEQKIVDIENERGGTHEELESSPVFPNMETESKVNYIVACYFFLLFLSAYATTKITSYSKNNKVVDESNRRIETIMKIVLSVLLFGCLAFMPSWYYQITRVVFCILFFYLTAFADRNGNTFLVMLFVCCAILFNPLFTINFPKQIWNVIDILVAGTLILSLYLDYKSKDEVYE